MNYLSRFTSNKSLRDLSTLGIGGTARYYLEVSSIEDMQGVLSYCYREGLDYLIIGKGSNCLFDDRGFDGLVVLNKIAFCHVEDQRIRVGAGYSFSLLGVQSARRGLAGLEFASGIPATVGGAIFMNAGANGQQTQDALTCVHYVNHKGELEILFKNQLHFSYRTSSFQSMKGAIVAAEFELSASSDARQKQIEIIQYRSKTQPYSDRSAGCVFRNPFQGSAGALIEKCGLKGSVCGGAEVSLLHANFIVNREEAKAEDVLELARRVQDSVKKQLGVELEMEIRCIPYKMSI
ncbi:MAG: UDP-N-acetylmuramate dehydrogenase [Chlamydiae bacterium]|nr:UDP-N-acetylmuramate dehydrogenase [Chlamydiota bacterium]